MLEVPAVLTVDELAALLRLRPQAVRLMARRGEISYCRVLGRYRFTRKHVDELLARTEMPRRQR